MKARDQLHCGACADDVQKCAGMSGMCEAMGVDNSVDRLGDMEPETAVRGQHVWRSNPRR